MAARFRIDLVLEERLKNVTGAEGADRGVSDAWGVLMADGEVMEDVISVVVVVVVSVSV